MGVLDGRVAVVTGAAHGPKAALGAEMAIALAAHGAAVVPADRRDTRSVADAITAAGGRAHAVAVDVSDEASVSAMIGATVARFGRLDILVNNAALASNTPPVPLAELTTAAWDEVMAVNIRGPFLCVRAALPAFRARGYGKVINIGSSTMLEGLPNRLHYVTSKGALFAMTRALARELGPDGIRVNTLAPGLVINEAVTAAFADRPHAIEAVRAGRAIPADVVPEDVIATLIHLASPASDAITGQMIVLDNGGQML